MANDERKGQQESTAVDENRQSPDCEAFNQKEQVSQYAGSGEDQVSLAFTHDCKPFHEFSKDEILPEHESDAAEMGHLIEVSTDGALLVDIQEVSEPLKVVQSSAPAPDSEVREVSAELPIPDVIAVSDGGKISGSVETDLETQGLVDRYIKELDQDILEFKKFEALFSKCNEFSSAFYNTVEELHENAAGIVGSRNITENPDIPQPLLETVGNSKAGVDLVLKMIAKLKDRMPKMDSSKKASEGDFVRLDYQLIPLDANERKSYLEDQATHNYALLTTMRRSAEDARESLFSFIKTHVLTTIDGVIDGKRHFQQQKCNLMDAYPACSEEIERWFGVYDDLLNIFEKLLHEFHLEAINAAVGEKVSYDLHEPFDTVVEDQFPDESVRELIRPGYKYTGPLFGGADQVIRPALVVVTKNR
jgi:molecular chaperone GrpE (heat shock protein)